MSFPVSGWAALRWACMVITNIFSESKLRLLNFYACPNHTVDDILSDHGYLDTWDNFAGPP